MKRVVCHKSNIQKISLDELYINENLNSQTIIAYVTNNGSGLGLQFYNDSCGLKGLYGFRYHKDLAMGKFKERLKYTSSTKIGSLELVLKARRELLIFDDFREFVKYAANHCTL